MSWSLSFSRASRSLPKARENEGGLVWLMFYMMKKQNFVNGDVICESVLQ